MWLINKQLGTFQTRNNDVFKKIGLNKVGNMAPNLI